MCKGVTTTMSCGHRLRHYTSRCQSSVDAKKLCEEPEGPKQSINDSCADCHAPYAIYEINRYHDELHHKLMESMRRAQTKEEVLAIQREVEKAHALRGSELRTASLLKWNGDVVWVPTDVKTDK